jgi:hypothetical protein
LNDNNKAVAEETKVEPAKAGENTSPETPSKSTEVEQTTEKKQESVPQSTTEDAEVQERPTRSEKRIHQLLEKLQDKQGNDQQIVDQPNAVSDVLGQGQMPPWWNQGQQTQSIFQPGTELTPEQLENEINRRAASVAELQTRRVLAENAESTKYLGTVKEFTEDLESLIKEAPEFADDYDKKFDKDFVDLYNGINYDQAGKFTGKMKASDIYAKLHSQSESGRTQGQAETSLKMAELAGNQAVAPSKGTRGPVDAETQDLFDKARRSGGNTQSWAEYLKKKVSPPQK